MGKILEYSNLGAAPADDDLLFMGDYSADNANPTTMRLTILDLNKKRNVDAADSNGLKLRDDGGNYGFLIHDGGNVGVGPGAATTPTSYLDIRGASDASLTLAQFLNPLALTDGRITQILVGTDRADYKSLALRYTYDTVNNDGLITLRHYEDATEGIHIKGDGNVGINTLTPENKLDVYSGDIRVRDGSYGVVLDASQAAIEGIAWSGTAWVDGVLQIQPDAGGDVYIMYDSGVPAFKVESSNKHVAVGPVNPAGSITDAKLHVLEATSGTLPALKLQNSVASSRAIIELSANSSEVKRFIMSDSSGVVGIRNTNAALGSGSVNFSEGRLNVNATTFGRRFRVDGSTAAADIFIGSFNSSNTTGTKIELRNSSTVAAARPTNLIWFGNMSGISGAEKVNWMAGAFRNTSADFFGIHYDGSDFSADNVAFDTTLANNLFYISNGGNVNIYGNAAANAFYDKGGTTVGNYCRGRFIQVFSFPFKITWEEQDRYTPLLSAPSDTTNNYVLGGNITKAFATKAPAAGRILRIDLSVTASETLNLKPHIFSGTTIPTSLSSTNSADYNGTAYGTAQLEITNPGTGLSTDFTIGFNDFDENTTYLDFSEGDFLIMQMNCTTGYADATVTVTVEFDIPDGLQT